MAKDHRWGGKQKNGSSRKSYFSRCPITTAANKARRIKKAERDRQDGSGRIHPSAREMRRGNNTKTHAFAA